MEHKLFLTLTLTPTNDTGFDLLYFSPRSKPKKKACDDQRMRASLTEAHRRAWHCLTRAHSASIFPPPQPSKSIRGFLSTRRNIKNHPWENLRAETMASIQHWLHIEFKPTGACRVRLSKWKFLRSGRGMIRGIGTFCVSLNIHCLTILEYIKLWGWNLHNKKMIGFQAY